VFLNQALDVSAARPTLRMPLRESQQLPLQWNLLADSVSLSDFNIVLAINDTRDAAVVALSDPRRRDCHLRKRQAGCTSARRKHGG
jgi:hypothetical protein